MFAMTYSGDGGYATRVVRVSNYTNATGNNGDQICHIHDMATHFAEWTTECCSEAEMGYNSMIRSNYGNYSMSYAPGSRVAHPTSADSYIGYRSILYLN